MAVVTQHQSILSISIYRDRSSHLIFCFYFPLVQILYVISHNWATVSSPIIITYLRGARTPGPRPASWPAMDGTSRGIRDFGGEGGQTDIVCHQMLSRQKPPQSGRVYTRRGDTHHDGSAYIACAGAVRLRPNAICFRWEET